jgi:3-oxoacyl-[acyl-carrier-protein] synthase-3
MSKKYSRIISTGSYLPEKILTNYDLEKMVDTSHDWIFERTGINQRHIADENESTVDMAYEASLKSIEKSNINAEDIDMIIVATTTPERAFPSTAVLLQNKLDIKDCFAFDINAACTGFIYALDIADKYIKNNSINNILVIGTEKMSTLVDWSDRNTCVLFGDGAGSVIIGSSNNPGIISSTIGSNGNYKDLLTVNPDSDFIEMKGNDVFKIAVNTMGKIARETLDQHDLKIDDVDWLIPHQANSRIISAIAKKLSLPSEKIIMTVGNHGNTSAASIPLAIDYAVESGDLKKEDTILLEAFGAGFTWGSTLLKF